jgi:type II secretory pathway component PulM
MDANRLVNVAGRNRAVPLEDDVLDKVDLGVKTRGPLSAVNPRIRFFLLQAGLSITKTPCLAASYQGIWDLPKKRVRQIEKEALKKQRVQSQLRTI